MTRVLVVAVAVLSIGACHAGLSAKKFIATQGPRGAAVTVEVRSGTVSGELLEVQDTALILLRQDAGQVVIVPLREIRGAVYKRRGLFIYRGAFVSTESAAEARLLSRYPAGLTPALRASLLAAHNQTEPAVAP